MEESDVRVVLLVCPRMEWDGMWKEVLETRQPGPGANQGGGKPLGYRQ